jgi:methyl-accepting chemotaxis protein
MTFSRKLYLLVAGAVLGLASLGAIGALQVIRVFDAANYATANSLPSIEHLDQALADLYKVRIMTWRHMAAATPEDKIRESDTIDGLKQDLAALLSRYLAEDISDDTDRAMSGKVQAALDKYFAVNASVLALSSAGDAEAARRKQLSVQDIVKHAEDALKDQREYNVKLAHDASERAATTKRDALIAAVCIAVATTLAIALAGYWLARQLVAGLEASIALADAVAGGDLTARIDADGSDEVARLQRALSRMSEQLTATIGDVKRSSDAIATASGEIASGNMDLSARTEAQASSLEETASSMEQLTSTVQQNAESAADARQLAEGAAGTAREGGKVVGDVVATMEAIAQASSRIVEIINVIDGIAFQTNILSLNAAVEAARAGEQGRGFAVVAGEVRNLAQRSATAAREIKALIDDSASKVRQGSALAGKAGASMQEIVDGVTRVAQVIGTIAEASREQGAGIVQVNEAVSQMDGMTQQNAALVEESAAAAVAMREQAEQLGRLVTMFRVERESPAARRPSHPGPGAGALRLAAP